MLFNKFPRMLQLFKPLSTVKVTVSQTVIKCPGNVAVKMARLSPNDPSSFSRPDLALVTHIKFSLKVNFERKIFDGHVNLTISKVDEAVNEVVLDAKDLNIKSISDNETGADCNFAISDALDEFGSKLTVQLPKKDINKYVLTIVYETKPTASGLQWLEPQQTAGKVYPYVFSQFQPIHARSFFPCQDTPTVKAPYEAMITCPKGLTPVMSAILKDNKDMMGNSMFFFKQDVPIQSYLIAIAVGALEHRKIGPRSTVWAEKEVIESAAYEFEDTEKQLQTAEDICGPYVWGIYDLLVLPPSFPFGGMENPCLTFVTPTLLAGDRSLANVVAHEIAHSWTGNLVTNYNFEHFWLNEGFTVFIERKILGRLEGAHMQDFQAIAGISELQETINDMGKDNPLTCLVVNLTGVHPDDAFSRVPYEKGQTFLRYLEEVVGGPNVFEPFLRKYFNTYKYKSITTDEFQKFFETEFAKIEAIKSIDWQKWLHTPGMPLVIPKYDKTLSKEVDELKTKLDLWNGNLVKSIPVNIDNVNSNIVIHLLQEIFESKPLSIEKLELMEGVFGNVKNAEIKFRWLRIGIKAGWEKILQPTLDWLNLVGRMKYCRPLYRDLYHWQYAREKTIENFKKNRKNMMHVSAYTLEADLHLRE